MLAARPTAHPSRESVDGVAWTKNKAAARAMQSEEDRSLLGLHVQQARGGGSWRGIASTTGGAGVVEGGSGGGGAWGTLVTLLCSQLGAGILSLPFAASLVGAPAAAALISGMAVLNVLTLWALTAAVDQQRPAMGGPGGCGFSYERLAALQLGPAAGRATSLIVLCTQFGALIAFLVILIGLAVPLAAASWPAAVTALGVDGLRAALAFSLAACVLFPLSLYQEIHKLALVAVLAIAAVLWTAGVVLSLGAPRLLHGPFPSPAAAPTVTDWLDAVPIVVFAFNCHQQLPPVHGQARPAARQLTSSVVVPAAVAICCALYTATALCGYARFGEHTPGESLAMRR